MALSVRVLIGVCVLAAVVAIQAMVLSVGMHRIEEGNVGLYWTGGALQNFTSDPGYHFRMPFFTQFKSVPIFVQTTEVANVPCGSSGGVMLYFDRIEVVHRLRRDMVVDTVRNYTEKFTDTWVRDRVHHEMNQLCSSRTLQQLYITDFDTMDEALHAQLFTAISHWVPGLQIIAVRLTKPRIPELIRSSFEHMEEVKSQFKIASQLQHSVRKGEETTRRSAVMEAEKLARVSVIDMKKEVSRTRSRIEVGVIEAEMTADRIREHADAALYRVQQEAESNSRLLTPAFLSFQRILHGSKNTRYYYGNRVPDMIVSSAGEEGGRGGGAVAEGAGKVLNLLS